MRTFFDDGLYCCNWRAVGIIALAMNLARLASKRVRSAKRSTIELGKRARGST